MKTQLLIATSDCDYADHLSAVLAENHTDAIDVAVCSEAAHLQGQLAARKYDIALFEASMVGAVELHSIRLPLLLWSEDEDTTDMAVAYGKVRKYRRISSMVSEILELYAKGQASDSSPNTKRARITAVWSPMGGVGKTTVSLAYAASKAAEGKQSTYLDMEPFSSIRTYFGETGRSISSVFEMLEIGEGNIKMLLRSIRQQDGGSDITYFCRPENFDDMNILNTENISALIGACSEVTDELIVDLSCVCDERTRKIFELADRVLLVTDGTSTANTKYAQFAIQNSVFQRIKGKAILVANKGAAVGEALVDEVIYLPLVQSDDSVAVFKSLSAAGFDV